MRRMALHTTFSLLQTRPLVGVRRVTFDDAVRDHQSELYGVALRILGDRDAAHDATSRALLKAFRSWSRYDQTRPVRHWLLRIAANEAISIARERSRDLAHRASDDEAQERPDRAPLPDESAMAREDRERVRRAVAGLPELYRVPVVLRYFSDLTLDEISAVTGRPAATVGVQLLRARAMLRTALEAAR